MERLLLKKSIWKKLPDGRVYTSIQNVLMTLGLAELANYDLKSIKGDKFSFMIELALKEFKKLLDERLIHQEGFNIIVDRDINLSADDLKEAYKKYIMPPKAKIKGIKYELSYVSSLELSKKHKNLLWRLSKLPFIVNKEDCKINPRNKEDNDLYNNESLLFKQLASNEGEVIKIPHFFDKRGRFYSESYGLNYQGDEWSKASLSPNYFRRVEYKNLKWLIIDIANHFGLDKETNHTKLTWFKAIRRHRFMSLIAASRGRGYLYDMADKPLLFKKALRAWVDATIYKKPINHFVSLDATASGMQILGLMSKDKELCKLTNLTHNDKCYDIYSIVGEEVANHIKLPYSKSIRKYCKKATMTYYYNSQKGLVEQSDLINQLGGSVRLSPAKLEEIISKISSGARLIKDEINKLFHRLPKSYNVIRFTMPDGFKVELPLIKKAMRQFRVNYRTINFMYDVLGNDGSNWRGLVPNIIHAIDSWIAREMVYRAKFPIYCIHDCFYCHPNNCDEMRRNMYEILREVANKDFFNYICKQICDDAGIEFEPITFDKENLIISPNAYFIC